MKKKIISTLSCLILVFATSLSSCVNLNKLLPEHSFGYGVREASPQGLLRLAYRRSEEHHKDVYDDDEDIPLILAFGFYDNYNHTNEEFFNKYLGVEKIVFYFSKYPWDGILMTGLDIPFVNEVYGEDNDAYKHLEEYDYYYFREYEPEDFYTTDFLVTSEKGELLVYSHEEEIFVPREIINAFDRSFGIGFTGILFMDRDSDKDDYKYETASSNMFIDFSDL